MLYQIRKAKDSGKIHHSKSINRVECNPRNLIATDGRISAKAALNFPPEEFCKKCFGDEPQIKIQMGLRMGVYEK